jgi:hypothetical protein
MYKKSEHTRESDLEYYERRYYNKLKDDSYNFKISDSIYRCPFCYNKDYSLTDHLRHASRMADNSRKTIKDIAKHSVLITYIQSYLNVKVDENKRPVAEEKLNLESEVQTEVKSKMVETTIDEEGVFNLELEGSFNCDIQTEATPEIDEETKEIVASDIKDIVKVTICRRSKDNYVYETVSKERELRIGANEKGEKNRFLTLEPLYQDKNSRSSSLKVEEKVKTSEVLMYGASMRALDSSTQTFVFDPGIRIHEFRMKASLYYNRTRGRVFHKKRSLMQEQFKILFYFIIYFLSLF